MPVLTPASRLISLIEEEKTEVGRAAPTWMVSFSDMITVILVFFIMMFVLAAALNEDQIRRLKRNLDAYIKTQRLQRSVNTLISEKGLVVSLEAKYMFDPGKAEIYEEAKQMLSDIAKFLIKTPNAVRIEGHTDNIPIHTREFPSNWELSSTRATNVTKYLIEEVGFPGKRISCAGYGKEQPVLTKTAKKKWQKEEKKHLEEKRREFLSKIAPEIPKGLRTHLLSIREFLFIEGADWTKMVEDKLPEPIIHKIGEREKEEMKRYQLEKYDRLVKACNFTPEERALNRRVDIVIQRMSGRIMRRERRIRARAPSLPTS